jgi:hypothetical protein
MCVDESHRPALGSCAGADNSRRPEGSWGVGPAIPQVAPKAKALEEKTKAERRTTKKKTRAAGRSPSRDNAESEEKEEEAPVHIIIVIERLSRAEKKTEKRSQAGAS